MKVPITIILVLIFVQLHAQDRKSFGFRAGGLTGFTYQYVDHNQMGFEVIAGFQDHGVRLVGLLEKHHRIKEKYKTDMYLVTGAGAHSGYLGYENHDTFLSDGVTWHHYHKTYAPIIGADFQVGLEFIFRSIPLQFSLDYKPYFEFFGEKSFKLDLWDFGISARYVITN
jgi:hypothetical protein